MKQTTHTEKSCSLGKMDLVAWRFGKAWDAHHRAEINRQLSSRPRLRPTTH